MKPKNNEFNFKDPVCGMEVSRLSAVDEYTYSGKTYYFCAHSCKESFEADPEKYVPRHRQHGIKSKQL